MINKNYAGDGIYKENILDYYKNPRKFGVLKNKDVRHKEFNPFCGDEIIVDVKFSEDKISEVKFSGQGCAISQAATDMILEKVEGMTKEEILKLNKENVLELLRIELGPVRLKCALLGLDTLQNAIKLEDKK